MPALWMRFRAEMRTRWRAVLLLGLVAGLSGGAVLTAVAGARRTDTAYRRMIEATAAPDFEVRAGSGAGLPFTTNEVERLRGVEMAAEVQSYYLTTRGPRSTLTERPFVLGSGSSDGRAFFEIGKPKLVEGRMPRPERADEILVSRILQREGSFDVGESAELVTAVIDPETGLIETRNVDFRIVGVGVTAEQIGLDERRQSGLQMLVTPAFVRAHADMTVDSALLVRVETPADARRFPGDARRLAGSQAVDVASTADDIGRVRRGVRPQVVALWIFAAVIGLAALLVVGQAIGRQLFLDAVDDSTLGALGLGSRGRFWLGMLRVAPVALLATVTAVIAAVAASPLMPIGPARVAEPDPGLHVDLLVIGLGAVTVVVVVLAVAIVPAWRLARRRLTGPTATRAFAQPRSRLAEQLASLGAPPTAVTGTRFALEPGHGPTAVPTRAILAGASAAAIALVAAIVVAANLRHVVDTPKVWGATWDVMVSVSTRSDELDEGTDLAGFLAFKEQEVGRRLDQAADVAAWSVVSANTVELNGRAVPAIGLRPAGGVDPTVIAGRLPRATNEIALGERTADELDVGLGSRVRTNRESVRVVGITVLPRFQALGGADEAALNRGAVLTLRGLLDRSTDLYTRFFLVRLETGVSTREAVRDLTESIPPPFAFAVAPVAVPEDVEALDRVTGTPVALAAILAALALATLIHALVTSVRRRRRDLAILVALGFTRRQLRAQVSATVAWQASVVALCALVVGVPVGIAAGRFLADVFADNLGALSDLVVPAGTLALIVAAALVLANIVAFVPGRLAARLQPTAALRTE